jgi:hypothetical protein
MHDNPLIPSMDDIPEDVFDQLVENIKSGKGPIVRRDGYDLICVRASEDLRALPVELAAEALLAYTRNLQNRYTEIDDSDIRAQLNNLAAYRLLSVMDWKEARTFTEKALGKPLFDSKDDWEIAQAKAKQTIDTLRPSVEKDRIESRNYKLLPPLSRPIAQLEWDFRSCPKNELLACLSYEYSRETVRTGSQ